MKESLTTIKDQTIHIIESIGISDKWSNTIQSILAVIILLTVAWIIDRIATKFMRYFIPRIVTKTKNKWDDKFLKNTVFSKIAHFLPGILIATTYHIIALANIRHFIESMLSTYFIIVFLLLANAVINTINDIYIEHRGSKGMGTIKVYLQLIKVFLFSLGVIAIISIFADKKFMDILKGIGAITTILLIVYKDTIMGFVAGIQLSANDMIKIGDWIVLPKDNADGNVIDIGLTTVKIQNWDKTITTVPTYKLVSESIINWRGMQESGARRIKRSISIDIESIHFLSQEEIERYRKIKLLTEYINEKTIEITEINKAIEDTVNQRKLSNVGTFRMYIENYLRSMDIVEFDMSFFVRQLQPTECGLPLEIYMFIKEQRLAYYEKIQADIFDHIFAMAPEFKLRIFQSPTAYSFSNIGK